MGKSSNKFLYKTLSKFVLAFFSFMWIASILFMVIYIKDGARATDWIKAIALFVLSSLAYFIEDRELERVILHTNKE